MRHVVTRCRCSSPFFPEETFDVADELNDVLALGGIDHLAPHDFLGVVISRRRGDRHEWSVPVVGLESAVAFTFKRMANRPEMGGYSGDLAGEVRLEWESLNLWVGAMMRGSVRSFWTFGFGSPFAFGRTRFALTSNLGGLELSDGLLINLLGRLRQGLVERPAPPPCSRS